MKLSTACCFLLVVLVAFVCASEKTSLAHNRRATPLNNSSRTSALENVFDLRDYGAIGDGIADDGPALQAALEAIGDAGGGTLFIPAGRYAIVTPVRKDFTGLATEVSIVGVESLTPPPPANSDGPTLSRGLDLTSEFAPRTGEQGIALSISGLQSFLIKDITFIGTPDVVSDALITLDFHAIDSATIRHCEFYGLSTQLGPAIVQSERSGLTIEQSAFLGTTANSGVYGSVIQNLEWRAIAISETVFVDYGQRPELFSKTGLSAPYSWVNIANAAATTSDSPRREVAIRSVFLDEGGFNGISSLPSGYEPPSAPIDLVYISGLYMNVSNLGSSGHYLSGLRNVLIENSHYGWSHNADSAINLVGASNAILDQLECSAAANRIRADEATERLTLINSVYTYLDSQAAVTRVLTPATPEDDPVQYVRQQFGLLAGRAPDAAAHFYWSDRLLQCGEDTECVNAERSALDGYLQNAPTPDFSISGTITNQSGAAVSGVTVTLSGAQTAVTQTGADGRYLFQELPTSGVYKVIAQRSHYMFDTPELTITTPRGNVTADFTARVNGYAINGSVLDAADQPIPNVLVSLSGSDTQSAFTDESGNYTLVAPGGGDYTVTVFRVNYSFSPAAVNFTSLSESTIANFIGSLMSYTISGRATLDGAALEGVSINLSGSTSAMMTTAKDGAWSFTVPAQGNYTVRAAKPDFLFSPANMTFSSLASDQQVDFTGTSLKLIQFSATSYNTSENTRTISVTVNRSGDTSQAASVIYSAVDGSAQQRSDVIPIIGQLRFEAGETSKTFRVFITDDTYVEGDESLTLSLSDPVGGTFGAESSATLTIADNDSSVTAPNAIDDARFFVRQHYRDFLNRSPDAEGLAFWSNQISACGSDAACVENRRINVSAAFFLSIEFQETGFLVYRLYQAAYAHAPEHLDEFLLDTRTIGEGVVVSNPGWQDLLAANKSSFMKAFVKRPEFEEAYPLQLTPSQFVTELNSNAGHALSESEVSSSIAEFGGTIGSENTDARAAILLRIAQSQSFTQRQKNPAFVLMQYFGYLQRNPHELPDTNLDGYNYWLAKLESFDGDFYRAEMVKAFIASAEYRSRFGAR